MKKVCIITSVHPIDDTRIKKQIMSLQKHNYKISLIGTKAKDFKKKDWGNLKLVLFDKPGSLFKRIFLVHTRITLAALKKKADIYHLHDPELIFLGFVLSLFGRIVIFDIHENIAEQIKQKKNLRFSGFFSKAYKVLERIFVWKFSLILAEDSYFNLYRNKRKVVIKNYPDLSMFLEYREKNKKNQPKENRLCYIGRINENRCFDVIIKALAKMKEEGERFEFHCVGETSKNIIKLVEEHNLGKEIIFYGRVELKEALAIIDNSMAGIALLKPLKNYLNSLPTKIFEYMAMGIPVITSDFPLYKRIIDDTESGLYVDPKSPEELITAIKKLKENKEIAQKMSEKGPINVKRKYSWSQEEKKLIEFYKQISVSRGAQ